MRCLRPLRVFRGLGSRAGWALAAVTMVRIAFGQSKPIVELRWDGPSQCPNASSVQERIRDIAGSVEVAPDRLRADGQITWTGEKYRLILVVSSGSASGTRVVESDSCEPLAGAAAISLGLLVRVARNAETVLTEEDLVGPLPVPGSRDAQPESTHRQSGGSVAPPLSPGRPDAGGNETDGLGSRTAVYWHLRVPTIGVGFGTLPAMTLGYGLGLGAGYSRWEAAFTGYFWPERSVQGPLPGYGANVTRYSVDLDICRTWRIDRFEGAPCLRAGLMQVVAKGTGEGFISKSANATVLTTGVAVLLRIYMTEWAALFLTGASEIDTSRPRLLNQGFGEIYRFPVLALKFGLGSEWIF